MSKVASPPQASAGPTALDPPAPPFARRSSTPSSSSLHERASRPLSEISENSGEERRRVSARQSASDLESPVPGKKSRPNSEVGVVVGVKSRPASELRDDKDPLGQAPSGLANGNGMAAAGVKRLSSAGLGVPAPPVLSIPINLNDYAAAVARGSRASSPAKPEKPMSLTIRTSSLQQDEGDENETPGAIDHDQARPSSPSTDSLSHPTLVAKRASLRPSPLGGVSYADILNTGSSSASQPIAGSAAAPPEYVPTIRPLAEASPHSPSLAEPDPVNSSVDSFHTAASASRPPPKAKPSWLRRASGTASFRKAKTPPPPEVASLPDNLQPPRLPPRRHGSLAPEATLGMGDNDEPRSYASAAAAGPSRSRSKLSTMSTLEEGQGRPAYMSMAPPPLPSRENSAGNGIRNRLAAFAASGVSSSGGAGSFGPAGGGGMPRSGSSATLASTGQAALREVQQRLPSSAQRFMGQAGSAVQKGWMGLRSRGMGGSISSLSALSPSEASGSGSRPSMMGRKVSAERAVYAQHQQQQSGDGPFFGSGVVLREGRALPGQVFGRDITEAGKAWGIVGAGVPLPGQSAFEARRRACLPAIMIRCVDYLEIWGPKEEGIFRISGRSSHISRLRKEFDAGADLDLADVDPGDLDPHAVSGLFKSYIRELPAPLLTHELSNKFETAARSRGHQRSHSISSFASTGSKDVAELLLELPLANWFALAEIVKLLYLIPQHSATNRMTLDALKLSFGPSFNIPGVVLTELLERREELFTNPPPPSAAETAHDLINFGDMDLSPPSIPFPTIPTVTLDSSPESSPRSVTPAGSSIHNAAEGFASSGSRPKKPVRLGSKPSLGRLFNGGSSSSRKGSIDTTASSIVDQTPPRVDLPGADERMPSFESEFGLAGRAASQQDKEETLRDPQVASSSERLQEAHYQPGTVSERAKAFSSLSASPSPSPVPSVSRSSASGTTSTPIADMFAGTGVQMPPLRQITPRSSMGSMSVPLQLDGGSGGVLRHTSGDWTALPNSAPSPVPANPAAKIRRGTSSFFQSGGGIDRHARSQSVSTAALVAAVSANNPAPKTEAGGARDPAESA